MARIQHNAAAEALSSFLKPWHESLTVPRKSQETVLRRLLSGYQQTDYGRKHGAEKITTAEEFTASFPIVTYKDLAPVIEQVMQGNFGALLPKPSVNWAMTRGTTGKSKFVPMTETDLEQRVACGARAILNYVHRSQRYDILEGSDLNLNFPSVVGTRMMGSKEITYGYSSGIYARYNAERMQINMVPEQDEIDALGGGITKRD